VREGCVDLNNLSSSLSCLERCSRPLSLILSTFLSLGLSRSQSSSPRPVLLRSGLRSCRSESSLRPPRGSSTLFSLRRISEGRTALRLFSRPFVLASSCRACRASSLTSMWVAWSWSALTLLRGCTSGDPGSLAEAVGAGRAR